MKPVHGLVRGGLAVLVVAGAVALAQPPEGGPPGGPGGPGGERRGPPSPEQFVERAMSFDADGDGKLDRGELKKFAEEMQAMRMRGGPGGPGGPGRGPGGPGGQGSGSRGPGGFGGGERRGSPPGGDGERPERPRRPE